MDSYTAKTYYKILLSIAILFAIQSCKKNDREDLLFVESNKSLGFHYPYFLFIPNQISTEDSLYMIIEPNNSGMTHDSLQKHIDIARFTASRDFYLGNYVSRKLQLPLLVPVFPRSETNWHIYTHDLDRDVMLQKGTALERIDRQLMYMFEDARKRLLQKGIKTHDAFLLTGFSASGSFTNRFTALHPEKVAASAAGGTGGLLILPVDSLQNELVIFPNGTGDMEMITGRPFQKDEFLATPQFYFLGENDTNDAVPFDDAYGDGEREQIYRLFDKRPILDRWSECQKIYLEEGVISEFKTYEDVGHEHPEKIKKDVLHFFQNK